MARAFTPYKYIKEGQRDVNTYPWASIVAEFPDSNKSFLRFQEVKNKARDKRLFHIWFPTSAALVWATCPVLESTHTAWRRCKSTKKKRLPQIFMRKIWGSLVIWYLLGNFRAEKFGGSRVNRRIVDCQKNCQWHIYSPRTTEALTSSLVLMLRATLIVGSLLPLK